MNRTVVTRSLVIAATLLTLSAPIVTKALSPTVDPDGSSHSQSVSSTPLILAAPVTFGVSGELSPTVDPDG